MKFKVSDSARGRFVIRDLNNEFLYQKRQVSAYSIYLPDLENCWTRELEEAQLYNHDEAQKLAKGFPRGSVTVIKVVRII